MSTHLDGLPGLIQPCQDDARAKETTVALKEECDNQDSPITGIAAESDSVDAKKLTSFKETEIKQRRSKNSFQKPHTRSLKQQKKTSPVLKEGSNLGEKEISVGINIGNTEHENNELGSDDSPMVKRSRHNPRLASLKVCSYDLTDKPHKCCHCDAQFSNIQNLQAHTEIHFSAKSYKCVLCAARFTHKTSLKKHEKCHTGIKPDVDANCGEKALGKTNLRKYTKSKDGKQSYCDDRLNNSHPFKLHV